jgi:hypothetical protein
VKASDKLVTAARKVAMCFDPVFERLPIDTQSGEFWLCLATWYVMTVLMEESSFEKLSKRLVDECDIGPLEQVGENLDVSRRAGQAGLRRAQPWIAASHACLSHASVTRRFHILKQLPRNLTAARHAIARGLEDLARELRLN